jgi:thymidylate synthase
VDDLVIQGIRHIYEHGERITPRAGNALQAYGVTYVLKNARDRVHTLRRPVSARYLARELLAYFRGSLNVNEGLVQASPFWNDLASETGQINSNYGHYVFHQKAGKLTQYEWVVALLEKNLKTRRATININQVHHKTDTKDFPCTIALQFFVREHRLCCDISSRSTDIITGLPYDMGFFSFLLELVHADLIQRGTRNLGLGYVAMRTTFTQIYDRRDDTARRLLSSRIPDDRMAMPTMTDAHAVLADILSGTAHTQVLQWIHHHAKILN